MRTPILLGADPKTAKTSAWVPVRYDNWRLVAEGLVDTKLALRHQVPETGKETTFNYTGNGEVFGPSIVKLEVEEPGTENAISVFAEEIV